MPATTYRRDIHGLRALAVVPVVLFHAGLGPPGGFLGVDVFFVISGYLITRILDDEIASGRFSLARFYERRARRILPALVVVLIASVPAAWLLLAPADMKEFAESVDAVALFMSNVFFWAKTGYFDTAAEFRPLLHTWSLAVEEQYYVLFPVALLALSRFGRRMSIVALIATTVASLALAQWLSLAHPGASFFLLPTRIWELMVGAVAALVMNSTAGPRMRAWPGAAAEAGATLGLAMVVASMAWIDATIPLPGVPACPVVVGAMLVLVFGDRSRVVQAILGNRTFVGVGLVSYSLYLWHQPVFAFARIRSIGELPVPFVTALLAAIVLLSWLTWRFVEVPARDRRRVGLPALVATSGVLGGALVAFGIAGHAADGFRDARMTPAQRTMLATAQGSPRQAECLGTPEHLIAPKDACRYFGNDIRWAVLGDSHAVELAYALAERLRARGTGLAQLTMAGCHPAFGRRDDTSVCFDWTRDAVSWLASQPGVDTVVVAYRINGHLFGGHITTYPRLRNEFEGLEREARWHAYVALTDALLRAGKRVVLVLQAPELSKDVNELIFHNGHVGGNIVGVDRGWWDRRNAYVRAHRGEIPKDVIVTDPTDLFCDSSSCLAASDGVALYFDESHPSIAGSGLVADDILRRVDAAQRLPD